MKNSNDTIGYRTRDLPPCSAVPQPTAPPRAPTYISCTIKYVPILLENNIKIEIQNLDYSGAVFSTIFQNELVTSRMSQ